MLVWGGQALVCGHVVEDANKLKWGRDVIEPMLNSIFHRTFCGLLLQSYSDLGFVVWDSSVAIKNRWLFSEKSL
jgi:hypothetical protein